MEKTYKLLQNISTPDGFFEKGTEKKESAWLVWKGIDKEWFTEKEWFEEVTPQRISMQEGRRFGEVFYRFYTDPRMDIALSAEQIEVVEAAVNGELFTKEDMIEFAKYTGDSSCYLSAEDDFPLWLKTRSNAH